MYVVTITSNILDVIAHCTTLHYVIIVLNEVCVDLLNDECIMTT
jgi:hypothetical protein